VLLPGQDRGRLGRLDALRRDAGELKTAMKLKDQVAIVTGAGRNIGEDTAKLLAREGAKVAVVDMDKGRGDRVAAEIAHAGGVAAAFVADVASEADIAKLVKDIVATWGRIDILVNNAAISDNKHVLEITKEQWDKVIAVTLTGPFLMSQHAARQMVAQGGGGKIVNIGSTSGFFGRSRAIAYTAAKGGVANLTRSLAVQLAPHRIRVNGVVPNKIGSPVGKDEFDPTRPVVNLVGRPGVPMDLARVILFLVSDESEFIAGEMLFVDGGVSAMLIGDKTG
jgi:NAD(P)-dependent dehydrogenase (short-subunit alcohol dehydrogenase family)